MPWHFSFSRYVYVPLNPAPTIAWPRLDLQARPLSIVLPPLATWVVTQKFLPPDTGGPGHFPKVGETHPHPPA